MRAEIRANLEREVASRLRARSKDSVMAGLLTVAAFELPKSLVEGESAARSPSAPSHDLVARGMSAQEHAAPAGALPGHRPSAACASG